MSRRKTQTNVSTGIAGLDQILRGGLPASNLYMLQGAPGAGKTTAALQFLRAGVAAGERCIYVSLSQTAAELTAIAQSHGWTLDGIRIDKLQVTVPVDVKKKFGADEKCPKVFRIPLTQLVKVAGEWAIKEEDVTCDFEPIEGGVTVEVRKI